MARNTKQESTLLFPELRDFYTSASEVGYALVRVVIGIIMIMHGWPKMMVAGVDRVATNFGNNYGLPMPTFMAYAAIFLEVAGGFALVIGLFTRFFASALAIELLIAMFAAHWAKGFSVGQGGYEYVLFLGIVMFFIALRGGGMYSADRAIGKEL